MKRGRTPTARKPISTRRSGCGRCWRGIDGFVSIERFESLSEPGKILSMSFWRDEDAVRQWRNVEEHRRIQRAGRQSIFADYRLRVAQVLRDYGMNEREQAPEDSRAAHAAP